MGRLNITPKVLIHPERVRIDASTHCQLSCPLCPRAVGHTIGGIGAGFLSLENFRNFLDINRHVRQIELSNWGEIFLNPEISEIIKCAWENGVELTAENGANLNKLDKTVAEALVRYRFRVIKIAIDGASPETYSIYRRHGNLNKVLDNVRLINAMKAQYQSSYPHLRWQFIPFGHNEHEIGDAQAIARDLKMEFVVKLSWEGLYLNQTFSPVRNKSLVRRASGLGVGDREEYYENYGFPFLQKRICAMLWHTPQINWDGKLLGCAVNYWGDYGNVFENQLSEVLQNDRIQHARRMLLGQVGEMKGIPCTNCPHYITIKRDGQWLTESEINSFSC